MSKELKKHYFKDCPSGHWATQKERFVDSILLSDCGQCKGRVLEALRQMNWMVLKPEEGALLKLLAWVTEDPRYRIDYTEEILARLR